MNLQTGPMNLLTQYDWCGQKMIHMYGFQDHLKVVT